MLWSRCILVSACELVYRARAEEVVIFVIELNCSWFKIVLFYKWCSTHSCCSLCSNNECVIVAGWSQISVDGIGCVHLRHISRLYQSQSRSTFSRMIVEYKLKFCWYVLLIIDRYSRIMLVLMDQIIQSPACCHLKILYKKLRHGEYCVCKYSSYSVSAAI